jgi:hypothetical protein
MAELRRVGACPVLQLKFSPVTGAMHVKNPLSSWRQAQGELGLFSMLDLLLSASVLRLRMFPLEASKTGAAIPRLGRSIAKLRQMKWAWTNRGVVHPSNSIGIYPQTRC